MGRAKLATAFRRLFSSGTGAAAEAKPIPSPKRDAPDVAGAFADAPVRRSHALAETVAISVGRPGGPPDSRLLILPGKVQITSSSLHVHYGSVPHMVSGAPAAAPAAR
jgi:hypothetical protein